MSKIIGIDLGTTKSVVAVWGENGPTIIPDAEGHKITPSVVALDPADGQWKVGYQARALAIEHPDAAAYSVKRFMGRRYHETMVTNSLEKLRILYGVYESGRYGNIEIEVAGHRLSPQAASAMILGQLKANAEAKLGFSISEAVITVPAYFHEGQRQATRDAGRIAGLEVKRILNEPTAACLAFGYQKLTEDRKQIAVYDLGGGTFDISILEVGGHRPFRVFAVNGNTFLGGDDLDWIIVDWALSRIGRGEERRLRQDMIALAHLRAAAEATKKQLSVAESASIQIPGHLSTESNIADLDLPLTRAEFEGLPGVQKWINDTLVPCNAALHDATKLCPDLKIQEVLMVGGQTRMPAIREAVRKFFGMEPNVSVEPEEVVGLGAAVQAAILAGDVTVRLADVVPLSLGINVLGNMEVLIHRNTAVPIIAEKVYTTPKRSQPEAEVQIYQGERPLVADNKKLASFTLKGFDPDTQPEIKVTFRVDDDGILHVEAHDKAYPEIRGDVLITDTVQLSDAELEAERRAYEEHGAEWTAERRRGETRVQLSQVVERLRDTLETKSERLPSDLLAEIQQVLAAASPEDIEKRLTILRDLWRRVNYVIEQKSIAQS